jgi:hypothetical protein
MRRDLRCGVYGCVGVGAWVCGCGCVGVWVCGCVGVLLVVAVCGGGGAKHLPTATTAMVIGNMSRVVTSVCTIIYAF